MLMVVICTISVFPMRSSRASVDRIRDDVRSKIYLDTKAELDKAEEEKRKKEAELKDAQGRLSNTEGRLAQIQGEKNSYQGKMKNLNEEMQLVADRLAVVEAKIEVTNIEIAETKLQLEDATRMRVEQYESMKKRIKFMYERGNDTYLEILFSAKSFSEFLNYADYIEQLSKYDRKMLDEYIETEKVIKDMTEQLDKELAELEDLKAQVVKEQGRVSGLISDTAADLADAADRFNNVAKEAAAYEKECDQKALEAAKAQAEYEAIKKQYEEELRLSQLAAQSAWRDISEITFEEGDRYLLANLIYCEAGAEPYAGKLAVGSVVINRVLSSRYPNTVTGAIYQYKQFSPVLDGHLASALANNKATDSCYQAADEAMAGQTNVGNCLYFRTPIEGLTGMQIGGHIFY